MVSVIVTTLIVSLPGEQDRPALAVAAGRSSAVHHQFVGAVAFAAGIAAVCDHG